MTHHPEEIVWTGNYLVTKRRGPWEYVGRARNIGAVVVLAVEDGHILLVEQWRVPLQRQCLELPAGLVGDEAEDEDVATAALRELEEETGWTADRVEIVGDFASSPGMVSEMFTLATAHGLSKVGVGGGLAGENITVHRVALNKVGHFIATKRDEGCAMDVKLLLLLSLI